jgi:glucokinase
MLQERARYLGVTLANLVNIINPEMIVIGGIFAQGHDLLLPIVAETVAERAFAGLGKQLTIQATSFGDDVGIVGASALALDAFFYQQPSTHAESEMML